MEQGGEVRGRILEVRYRVCASCVSMSRKRLLKWEGMRMGMGMGMGKGKGRI